MNKQSWDLEMKLLKSSRVLMAFVILTLVLPFLNSSVNAATTGLNCSSDDVKIVPLHSSSFYVNPKRGYDAQWIGYRIDAIGVNGKIITSAGARLQNKVENLTFTQSGNYSTAYALLRDVGPKNGSLSHQLNLDIGNQTISCTYIFKNVAQSEDLMSNTLDFVSPANLSYGSTAPILYEGTDGTYLSVAAQGRAGVLEKGSIVSLSPTPKVTWESSVDLTLVKVSWRAGNSTQMYKDQLWFPSPSDGSSDYYVEYVFKANVNNPTSWQISPTIFVKDEISTTNSMQNSSTQFLVIDRPDTEMYAATNHGFTSILSVAGGTPPYEWSLQSGSMPPGISLISSGQISGTAHKPGDYSFTLSVKSAGGSSSKRTNMNFVIHVADAVISSQSPKSGIVGTPYSYGPFSVAGIENFTWSQSGTIIAPGLIFNENGAITGTPTQEGTFKFTLSAIGSSDAGAKINENGKVIADAQILTATRTFKIKISKAKVKSSSSLSNTFVDLELGGNGVWPAGTNNPYGYGGYHSYAEINPNQGMQCYSLENNLGTASVRMQNDYKGILNSSVGSSPSDPYAADLNGGFCLFAEVILNQPKANQEVRATGVRIGFTFDWVESDGSVVPFGNDETITPISRPLNLQYFENRGSDSLVKNSIGENFQLDNIPLADMLIDKRNAKSTSPDELMRQSIVLAVRYKGPKRNDLLRSLEQIKLDPAKYPYLRVKIEVSANETERDYQRDGQGDNGFGNGEDSAPGNSLNNNGANNSERTSPNTKSTITINSNSTSTLLEEPQIACSTGADNGYGNGEDSSPGKSGSNNNANNNPNNSYPGNSDQEAGSDKSPSNVDANCSGTYFDFNNHAIMFFTQAKWKPYLVTYNANGGSVQGTPTYSDPTIYARYSPITPGLVGTTSVLVQPPTGQNFAFWSQSSDCIYSQPSFEIISDTMIYACWSPNGNGDKTPPPPGRDPFYLPLTITEEPVSPVILETVNEVPSLIPLRNIPNLQGFIAPSFSIQNSPYKVEKSAQGRFVASSGLVLAPPGIPDGYELAFAAADIPVFKGKALFSTTTDGQGVVIRSDSGWTGFLHITAYAVPKPTVSLRASASSFKAKMNAIKMTMDVQIYPDAPIKGLFSNNTNGSTFIKWESSPTPTTTGYQLYLNSQLICTTQKLSCTVSRLIGPKSKLVVIAVGMQRTRSEEMRPVYRQGKAFIFAATVYFDTSKAIVKPQDQKLLDKVVALVKEAGFTQVYVEGHTDIRQKSINLNLSKARVASVVSYLSKRLPGVSFSGTALADKNPAVKGNSKLALALNRRTEIRVR